MIISQTPLRVSLAGGGTDFADYYGAHGGAVLSMAIDKYIYIIVKERYDDLIYLNYSQKEVVTDVAEIRHELIREALKKTGVTRGIEITCLADIPSEGTGLGSSGAFTVGLLNALHTYQGQQLDAGSLAREATEIEMVHVQRPIGLQDQCIAAHGGMKLFEFQAADHVVVRPVALPEEQLRKVVSNLLLFYTNQTRQSSTILAEQKENIPRTTPLLHSIKAHVYRIYDALLRGEFDVIGDSLRESWDLKKHLAPGVTNAVIDDAYGAALAAGAIGGKICGAGGGGFLLLYCPRDRQDALRSRLRLRELPFMVERWGSRILLNVQKYGWKL